MIFLMKKILFDECFSRSIKVKEDLMAHIFWITCGKKSESWVQKLWSIINNPIWQVNRTVCSMTREERKIISLVHFCGFSRIISNSESQYLKCGPGENGNVRPSICWYYSVDVNGLSVWTKIRSGGLPNSNFMHCLKMAL